MQLRMIRPRSLVTALLALLLASGTIALFAGIHFRWYTAPYPAFGKAVAWAINMPEPAYNFAAVIPGTLYRSSLPDDRLLKYSRRHHGVRFLVSLIGSASVHETARALGMEVTVFDWRKRMPTAEELAMLLNIIEQRTPLLVHCRAGRDRTGYAMALMRIRQQQWPLDRALAEMGEYGHARSRRETTQKLLEDWAAELSADRTAFQ